jgi:electron transfer flavoprotein beta subunit
VSNEINKPRFPTVQGILKASRREIPVWSAADLAVDVGTVGGHAAGLELIQLYKPVFTGGCEFFEGETQEEAAEHLALRLRADKII